MLACAPTQEPWRHRQACAGRPHGSHRGAGAASTTGVLLASLAGAAYSLATGRVGTLAASTFLVAAIVTAPVLALVPVAWAADLRAWPAPLFLGAITTGLAYALFTRGLARLTTSTAVTLSLIEPLTAWLLAILVVGEPVTAQRFLGAMLIFGGLAIVSLAPNRGAARAA
ncbi:DMT family transporter [Cereibacter azotoformans]|uniref:Catalase n=1 Tax=Cereibacter sphaeroides (strain ATCC 17025 / ATH 2.4.3) TaxID=349102 RepID=A4WXS5_CERS5|nr:DMT family transporter [Cereibacter azotoformans]ULB11644.1 DMT family transporter [Cereibacter azotoformans]